MPALRLTACSAISMNPPYRTCFLHNAHPANAAANCVGNIRGTQMRIVSPSDAFVSMAKCFCYNGHRHTLEGQTSTVSAAEVMKAGFWKLRGFTGLCQRSGLLRWPPFLSIRSEKNNLSGRLPDGEFLEQTHAFLLEIHGTSNASFCLT